MTERVRIDEKYLQNQVTSIFSSVKTSPFQDDKTFILTYVYTIRLEMTDQFFDVIVTDSDYLLINLPIT